MAQVLYQDTDQTQDSEKMTFDFVVKGVMSLVLIYQTRGPIYSVTYIKLFPKHKHIYFTLSAAH
jgi:hypothetical protein